MPKPQKGIKYHIQVEKDRRDRERQEDDPMLPTFIPLTQRSETGKARWWARIGKQAGSKKFYAELE